MYRSTADDTANTAQPSGLALLFSGGERPDRTAMREAIARTGGLTISHDPVGNGPGDPEEGGADCWLELLKDGLTFDVLGLAPGPSLALPPTLHKLDAPSAREFDEAEAVFILPGPHLADGAASLPVMRTQLAIAAMLMEAIGNVAAICWLPARLRVEPEMFRRMVEAWLRGGPFPALALCAFVPNADGEIETRGFSFFCGRELRITKEVAADRLAATRLAIRLIDAIVADGSIEGLRELTDGDGRRLLLETADADTPIVVTLLRR